MQMSERFTSSSSHGEPSTLPRVRFAGVPAGGRRFHEEPEWAKPVLLRMAERGILESNATGHFRIKPVRKKKQEQTAGSRRTSQKFSRKAAWKSKEPARKAAIGSDEYYDQL